MFILLNNCPFDDAKVRQFWEVGKSFADFCPKLWRQGQGSATYRRRDGRIVSQTVCCFSHWDRFLGMTAAMTQRRNFCIFLCATKTFRAKYLQVSQKKTIFAANY